MSMDFLSTVGGTFAPKEWLIKSVVIVSMLILKGMITSSALNCILFLSFGSLGGQFVFTLLARMDMWRPTLQMLEDLNLL